MKHVTIVFILFSMLGSANVFAGNGEQSRIREVNRTVNQFVSEIVSDPSAKSDINVEMIPTFKRLMKKLLRTSDINEIKKVGLEAKNNCGTKALEVWNFFAFDCTEESDIEPSAPINMQFSCGLPGAPNPRTPEYKELHAFNQAGETIIQCLLLNGYVAGDEMGLL